MKGCIFVSFRYLDTDNITKSWLKMYLRTRYRSKLGWFFWFGPIHVTIHRNLADDNHDEARACATTYPNDSYVSTRNRCKVGE